MTSESIDKLIDGLKYGGFLVSAASGLVGFFAKQVWEEKTERPAIIAPGHTGKTTRSLTAWGWLSLVLLIIGSTVGFGSLWVESLRSRDKERLEAEQRKQQQTAHAQEIARIQKENQDEMAKRLQNQSVQMAQFYLQGRDLDAQRAVALEQARQGGVEIKFPESTNTFSVSNLSAEIKKAAASLPDEFRAATEARNKAEAERVATGVKAKLIDKLIRPRIIEVRALIPKIIAQIQSEGLVTVTNTTPIPALPERIVFSKSETNFNPNGYRPYWEENYFDSSYWQRVDFLHGEQWIISIMPGILSSTSETNHNFFPRIRISNPGPNPNYLWETHLVMLSFEPVSLEMQIAGTGNPIESDKTRKPEDRLAVALVELLRKSLTKTPPQ